MILRDSSNQSVCPMRQADSQAIEHKTWILESVAPGWLKTYFWCNYNVRIIIYFVLKYFTIENCDIRGFIWFSIFKLLFCSHTDTNFSAFVDRPTAIQTVHNCIFQQISANTFENTYLCDSPSIVGRDKWWVWTMWLTTSKRGKIGMSGFFMNKST